jgi:sigma-B regulation protein RsbU (phosphoserine phosphatase)
MATPTSPDIRNVLRERRARLKRALDVTPAREPLLRLLGEVDAALARLDQGTWGRCEACKGEIEPEVLRADPLATFCLDDMTPVQKEMLQHDLDLTQRLQSTLLPKPWLSTGAWEAASHYEPAGAVSGDCLDLVPAEDGGLFFLLGDVAGKGLAASMLMSYVLATFRSLAALDLPLADRLRQANRVFCEGTGGGSRYATLVVGRAAADGTVEFGCAGHLPPVLVRRGDAARLSGGGLPLGMFFATAYDTVTLRLEAGDALVFVTDGITEAERADGSDYGFDRLGRAAGSVRDGSAADMLRACLADVREFAGTGPCHDDRTMLVLRRVG